VSIAIQVAPPYAKTFLKRGCIPNHEEEIARGIIEN